jgi:hypothetical protein
MGTVMYKDIVRWAKKARVADLTYNHCDNVTMSVLLACRKVIYGKLISTSWILVLYFGYVFSIYQFYVQESIAVT